MQISIDLIGHYTIKATQISMVRIKVWSLVILCLSTGLGTHQLVDRLSIPAIVRALWNHEARFSCSITNIHTDNGSQLRYLGDLSEIHQGQVEEIRLFCSLSSQHVSASGGQYNSIVESSICRVKLFWSMAHKTQITFITTCAAGF